MSPRTVLAWIGVIACGVIAAALIALIAAFGVALIRMIVGS